MESLHKSKFGNKNIDDQNWVFSVGQHTGGRNAHTSLLLEGIHTDGLKVKHWSHWADWIPSKVVDINGEREANEAEMNSGTLKGRVREKWKDIEWNNGTKTEFGDAHKEFDKYSNKRSSFLIKRNEGQDSQTQIAQDKSDPPIYHFYGNLNGGINCASWVSRIAGKAGLSISSTETFYLSSFFSDTKWGDKVDTPSELMSNAKDLENQRDQK